MAWVSRGIQRAVEKAGVKIERMDRQSIKIWNKDVEPGDPRDFTGYYWQKVRKGRVEDQIGPFPCPSAAICDAFRHLQLRKS
jgi:hypothetical protein